jgi:hypothetical protein
MPTDILEFDSPARISVKSECVNKISLRCLLRHPSGDPQEISQDEILLA